MKRNSSWSQGQGAIAASNTSGSQVATRVPSILATTRSAIAMLLLDAVAPVLGVLCTLFIQVPPSLLILYLGFFAGFLFYIGASDILPEAHSQNRSSTTLSLIGLTCLGAAFIFVVVRVAG